MIKSVRVKNIARWKGEHLIEYGKGIHILDGKYGAGKSSLLVDSLQLVLTNTARTSFDGIITKGEDSGEVEIIWETPSNEKYKLYWYHKLKKINKVKNKKTGLFKDKIEAAKTVWETFFFDPVENDYVKSYKTPEAILGLPYSLASKTFLIKQNDIDGFSNVGPTEKYDIIADSFNISTLFNIGDKANQKIKENISEKNILLDDLKDINIIDFENIKKLEEQKNGLIQKIDKNKNTKEKLKQKIEDLRLKQNKYLQIENNQRSVDDNNLIINQLKEIDVKSIEDQIKKYKKLLEKESTSAIEKLESQLFVKKGEKEHIESAFKQELNSFIGTKNIKINTLYQKVKELHQKYINSKGDYSRFTEEYSKQIKLLNIEDISLKIEKINNKKNLELQESRILEDRINGTKSIIANVKNLKENTCPTCYRSLPAEQKQIVIETFTKKLEQYEKDLELSLNKNKITNQNLLNSQKTLEDFKLYQLFLENQKYGELGKKENQLYKSTKEELEKEEQEIKDKYNSKISVLTNSLIKLQAEFDNLSAKSKVKEYQDKIGQLQLTSFNINGKIYNIQEVKSSISILEDQNKIYGNKIKEIIKDLKIKNDKIIELKEIIEKEYQDNLIQINLIEENNSVLLNQQLELNIQLNNLIQLKDRYLKVKDKVEQINDKLERFEKIASIFGKKGQPKTIIEKIIIPQLELKSNDLLTEMTDGKYQIELSLTSFTQSGKENKKNTFDILVYQDGIKQNYDSLSGGEKMNVNYALRLGITECFNDLLGRKTNDLLILDETFNAIDSDTSEEQILRSIKETSKKYKQIFIITHVNELKEGLQGVSKIHSILKKGKYSILETSN